MFAVIIEYECKCNLKKPFDDPFEHDRYYQKIDDFRGSTKLGEQRVMKEERYHKEPDTYDGGNGSYIHRYTSSGRYLPTDNREPPGETCYSVWVDSPSLSSVTHATLDMVGPDGLHAVPNRRVMNFGGLATVQRFPDCPTPPGPCGEQSRDIYYHVEVMYDYVAGQGIVVRGRGY